MEKQQYPRFTVIIPQKDRAEYLIHTLKTCMVQDYPNFEVIVSDDCSEDNSVEMARELAKKDPRIKVYAHEHHLGMRDNFEFALNQVQPGYVMALGGDDGLVYGGIQKMYDVIKQTGAELLTWANAGFSYGEPCGLSIRRKKDPGIKMVKSKDYLDNLSKNLYYLNDDCPMFYIKGVASTDLVEKVKSRTPDHCFYHCPTPDGFSGVVLAGEVEQFAFSYEPFSINGATTKSQGANYMRNDAKSKKESQQFFNDNIRKTMHKELASQPYSPLITLMSADYLLSASDLPGWPGSFTPIDYELLIRKCFIEMSQPCYAVEVLPREIEIVRNIAKYHGLEDLFNSLLESIQKKTFKTTGKFYPVITNSRFCYNADELGIKNIYDACLVIPAFYKIGQIQGLKYYWRAAKNSFQTWKQLMFCAKGNFPK